MRAATRQRRSAPGWRGEIHLKISLADEPPDNDPTLDPGVDQLDAGPVRDLEPQTDPDVTLSELYNGLLEILDAIDEDRLLSLEMSSQQNGRRVGVQAHHRHRRPERLGRKD
jgi:hypothetical protein